jgi:hypothetical protein
LNSNNTFLSLQRFLYPTAASAASTAAPVASSSSNTAAPNPVPSPYQPPMSSFSVQAVQALQPQMLTQQQINSPQPQIPIGEHYQQNYIPLNLTNLY